MLLAVISPFLVFSAFLLLLLVTLSVPFIKTIYVLRLSIYAGTSILNASANAVARFGVWGFCISSINVSIVGWQNTAAPEECSKPRLGYTFDSTEQQILHEQNVNPNTFSRAITAAMVLHPIACGIIFLTLCSSLFLIRRRTAGISRLAVFMTLGLGLLSAILATAVFLIDVIFVAVVKNRIKNQSEGLVTGTWGNGVWMVLGATVALWGALVPTSMVLFEARRSKGKVY